MTDDASHSMGGNSADQLRGYIHRIERLETEIDELNADKREVYAEIKACGFCKKTLRKLVIRRRKDRSELEEEDALLDLYEQVLSARTPDPLED